MNAYYYELANLVFGHYQISPYTKGRFGAYYLTVQDYLIALSFLDPIKNIYSLLKSFSTQKEVLDYLLGTISWIIMETLIGNEAYADYFLDRLKIIHKES
jgi:hypothetical protein